MLVHEVQIGELDDDEVDMGEFEVIEVIIVQQLDENDFELIEMKIQTFYFYDDEGEDEPEIQIDLLDIDDTGEYDEALFL